MNNLSQTEINLGRIIILARLSICEKMFFGSHIDPYLQIWPLDTQGLLMDPTNLSFDHKVCKCIAKWRIDNPYLNSVFILSILLFTVSRFRLIMTITQRLRFVHQILQRSIKSNMRFVSMSCRMFDFFLIFRIWLILLLSFPMLPIIDLYVLVMKLQLQWPPHSLDWRKFRKIMWTH